MDKKQKLLKQSTAIRTFPVKKVKDIVDMFYVDDHIEVKPFTSNITEWLKPVIDLSDFKYLYPTNGITEGINYWYMQEDRKVFRHKDDYIWLPESDSGDIIYMSSPSSASGNIKNTPQDIPVVLDIAHVGSCSKKVSFGKPPENVEKVFFSLSKCLLCVIFSSKALYRLANLFLSGSSQIPPLIKRNFFNIASCSADSDADVSAFPPPPLVGEIFSGATKNLATYSGSK